MIFINLKIFILLLWPPFSLVEQNHLANFSRGHSCNICVKLFFLGGVLGDFV